MMLAPLKSEEVEGTDWVQHFVHDFRGRLRALLTTDAFRTLPPVLLLSMLDPRLTWEGEAGPPPSVHKADGSPLTNDDLNRLEVLGPSPPRHRVSSPPLFPLPPSWRTVGDTPPVSCKSSMRTRGPGLRDCSQVCLYFVGAHWMLLVRGLLLPVLGLRKKVRYCAKLTRTHAHMHVCTHACAHVYTRLLLPINVHVCTCGTTSNSRGLRFEWGCFC